MRLECKNCGKIYEVDSQKIPPSGKKVKCTNCGHIWVQRNPEFDDISENGATKIVSSDFNENRKQNVNQNNDDKNIEIYSRNDKGDSDNKNSLNFNVLDKSLQKAINFSASDKKTEEKDNNQTLVETDASDISSEIVTDSTDSKPQKQSEQAQIKEEHIVEKKIPSYLKASVFGFIIIMLILLCTLFQEIMPYSIRKVFRFIGIYNTDNVRITETHVKVIFDHGKIKLKVESTITNQSEKSKFVPNIYGVLYDKNKHSILSVKLYDGQYLMKSGESYKFERVIESVPSNVDMLEIKIRNIFERIL